MTTLTTLERLTLTAVRAGTLRRRKTSPPIMAVPALKGLVERGLLRVRDIDNKLTITDEGIAAMAAPVS